MPSLDAVISNSVEMCIRDRDYLEYCENCAAPLKESQAAAGEPTSGGAREQRSWDFVASPDWSKPEFSANTVSETDIPEGFTPQSFRSRFSAEPVQQPASALSLIHI